MTQPPPLFITARPGIRQFVADYFWFLVKNVIGWLLILISGPVGVALPGPGGIPLFLIGFGLISLPGKRRLTSRMLRGRQLNLTRRPFVFFKLAVALLLPLGLFWYAAHRDQQWVAWLVNHVWISLSIYGAAVVIGWHLAYRLLQLVNLFIKALPRMRRKLRPWLRRHGVHLLPPRRRRRGRGATSSNDDSESDEQTIISLHHRHRARLRQWWKASSRYIRLGVATTLMAIIILMMLRPIYRSWPSVQERLLASWTQASLNLLIPGLIFTIMFALFLFIFRALVWRRMLCAFGHDIPLTPAMRIWSYSELARYLPGSIFQVIGRAYMLRRYGVSGTVSSTVQLLELTLFLLANIVLALACLAWLGVKQMDGPARNWMLTAMILAPALAILVHPRIYYRLVNWVLARLGKPAIVQRLRGKQMLLLLGWTFIGLLWQSAGVYIVAAGPLKLQLAKWWVVAGAYSLAWVAGFLAIFSSAGMGVRELVFGTVMLLILPPRVRAELGDTSVILATMYFIAFLLRLWTIIGELVFAGVVTYLDRRHVAHDLINTDVEPSAATLTTQDRV